MTFFATFKNILEKKKRKIGKLFSFACLIFQNPNTFLFLEFNNFKGNLKRKKEREEGEGPGMEKKGKLWIEVGLDV